MEGKNKNLKEAAEFLDMSESKLRRLMRANRIGFYGEFGEQKSFSVNKHLLPYLESIETKAAEPSARKERKTRSHNNSYRYRSGVFENLTV